MMMFKRRVTAYLEDVYFDDVFTGANFDDFLTDANFDDALNDAQEKSPSTPGGCLEADLEEINHLIANDLSQVETTFWDIVTPCSSP